MRRYVVRRSSPYAWLALGFLLLAVGEVQGQNPEGRGFGVGMRTGIGYAPVVPDVMGGLSVWRFVGNGRMGIFSDFKLTVPSVQRDRIYCPPEIVDCSVPWVERERNDLVMRDIDEYLLVNLGGIWTLTSEFALLAGGGLVRQSRYREYFHEEEDQEARITDSGGYYVPYDPLSSWGGQVVVGLLMRLGQNLVVRFGYETKPGGMSLGGYWALPW